MASHMNQRRNFEPAVFIELFERPRQCFSMPLYHECERVVERFKSTLEQHLLKVVTRKTDRDQHIPLFVTAYRSYSSVQINVNTLDLTHF